MQDNQAQSSHLLVIRHAVPDDADGLAEFISQLAAHHGDQATTDADRLKADLFMSPPWALALVAMRDTNLLGFALLVRLYRAQLALRSMDLHHLFVVPEARNSGIGQALIQVASVEAEVQGCARLMVGSHHDNHRVQDFSRKLGFQDVPPGAPRFRRQLVAGT